VLVLAVRQVLNATPLALFIEGLGLPRAVQSDQAATLTSTIAPPPSDMVLRLAMFASWRIPIAEGMAGALMNILTFYATRFTVPIIGLVLVLASEAPYHSIYAWTALLGGAVGAFILGLLWAVLRRESTAIWIASTAGRLWSRVRPSATTDTWPASAVDFRVHVVSRARRGIPISLLALVVMVVVDGLLLALCLRFVGVSAADVSTVAVVGVFLTAYPLTLFPLAGLGILDATVLAALVDIGGIAIEPDLVAGLVLYRVTTLLTPMLFGVASIAWWRRTQREKEHVDVP